MDNSENISREEKIALIDGLIEKWQGQDSDFVDSLKNQKELLSKPTIFYTEENEEDNIDCISANIEIDEKTAESREYLYMQIGRFINTLAKNKNLTEKLAVEKVSLIINEAFRIYTKEQSRFLDLSVNAEKLLSLPGYSDETVLAMKHAFGQLLTTKVESLMRLASEQALVD